MQVWPKNSSNSTIEIASFAIPDEESARLSIVSQLYPAWTVGQDQWICSVHSGYKLIWVPEIAYPYSIIVISRNGSAFVSFYNCNIGCDWANCYSSSYVNGL
jgi:hypothetical protein